MKSVKKRTKFKLKNTKKRSKLRKTNKKFDDYVILKEQQTKFDRATVI